MGRWPLIPENYCNVQLPWDNLQAVIADPSPVTSFTDRVINIRSIRLMTSIMSSPSWKTEKTCADTVSQHAKRFQDEVVHQLPPAFRLTNPDTEWDAALPSIARKREHLRATLYAIIANIHRAFIDPYSNPSSHNSPRFELAEAHQMTLAEACCETISSLIRLHQLLGGGGAQQYFFIPMALIEASAVLGMCLVSMSVVGMPQYFTACGLPRDLDMKERLYNAFQAALSLLTVLSELSETARKGVKILGILKKKVEMQLELETQAHIGHITDDYSGSLQHADGARRDELNLAKINPEIVQETASRLPDGIFNTWNIRDEGLESLESEWATLAYSADQSWFFND